MMGAENGWRQDSLQVAVLGPLGTYTHEAAHSRFGQNVDYKECETIQGIFDEVASTEAIGVVPQENSIFGSVIETYDALKAGGFICGDVVLQVQHCLVVKDGVRLEDIRRIFSHEQALGQCRQFLTTHVTDVTLIKTTSTAAAARMLLENETDCAAICSKVCVTLFKGLSVLEEGIQDVKTNFTRFYIISRHERVMTGSGEPQRALVRLSHVQTSSQILHILKTLSDAGLDCSRIDRRPAPGHVPFTDTYFIELVQSGDQSNDSWRSRIDRAIEHVREGTTAQLLSTCTTIVPMTAANPLVGPSALRDVIDPQFYQNNFSVEHYIKNDLNIKLDKDDQLCRLFLTPAGCPLGPLHCPLRHTTPSSQNFQPPKLAPTHPRERERLSTVCKHWLRGLCKKGDACEFLHEYNLRRMPECWWFAKYGFCSAGDECLYAHPKERKVECPDYNRGFCKLGPTCPRKHVRKVACQLYLTGFCPLGPTCPRGHPKPGLPPPKAYEPPEPPANRDLGPPPPGYGRYADFDRGMGGGGGSGAGGMPPRRNPDDVLCFKCGEKGHYANYCRNRNVPGNRGGVDRTKRYGQED